MSQYNTKQYNAGQFNAGVDNRGFPTLSYTDDRNLPFKLEIHEQNGDLVWTLPEWYGGRWIEQLNTPEHLSFTYADAGDGRCDEFTLGREVWIYEGDYAEPSQKFLIQNTNDIESTARTVTVNCKSLLYQLTHEHVDTYEKTTDTKISQVLADIFNDFQVNTNPIYVGEIDDAIGDTLWQGKLQIKSIRQCIDSLWSLTGGSFWVDSNRNFNWKENPGLSGRFELRIGRTVNLIQKSTSDGELANRIIAYGRGLSESRRLTVTVNDTTSQGIYGIRTAFLDRPDIFDSTELTNAANEMLGKRAYPKVSYDIGNVDISRLDSGVDYSFDIHTLTLGTKVNLIGNLNSLDIETKIQTIERNLDNPMSVKVHLSNPNSETDSYGKQKTIGDHIADLKKLHNAGDTGTADALGEMLSDDYGDADDSDALQDATIDAVSECMENPLSHNKYNRIRNALGGVALADDDYQKDLLAADTERLNAGDPSGETYVEDWVDAASLALAGNPVVASGVLVRQITVYEVSTESSLPSGVASYSLGRAVDTGYWYKRNSANNDWDLLVSWESL